MKSNAITISNPRGLEIEPLKVDQYKILSVEVAEELDQYLRRLATATVVNKNDIGNWGGNVHHIELKDCYNRASKGPKTTPYDQLVSQRLIIHDIKSPQYGDLNIVRWELHPSDITM